MDGYRKADIALDKLLVNPENYRFDPVKNQQEAMRVMLLSQKDKILNLARDIAQRGLNPMEILAVKEAGSDRYISLEGNRRLTALKLLSNPNEVPDDYPYKGVFEELHARYKDTLPTAVECVIYSADEQDIADSWVLLKHTGQNLGIGTVPWNTYQKQRFEDRHTKKQSTTIQVADFLKVNGVDISRVLATNLERLLTTPQVRHALGFDFINRQLALNEPEADVLQKLKKVVDRMNAKGFSVRDIDHVTDRLKWIHDVLGLQPAPVASSPESAPKPPPATSNRNATSPASQSAPVAVPSGGKSASQPSTATTGTSAAPLPPAPPPPPSTPSVYYTLVAPTKVLPLTIPEKIRSIYKELQIVNIARYRPAPHAVAALLRILVEITAQEYLIKKQSFSYDSHNNFRNPANPGGNYQELGAKLRYIASQCGLPGNIARVLQALLGQHLMTAELNQVMHSTIFTASGSSIQDLWKNFEKVFDYLIDEMK